MSYVAVRLVSAAADSVAAHVTPGTFVYWQADGPKFVTCGLATSLTEDVEAAAQRVADINGGVGGYSGIVVELVEFAVTEIVPP